MCLQQIMLQSRLIKTNGLKKRTHTHTYGTLIIRSRQNRRRKEKSSILINKLNFPPMNETFLWNSRPFFTIHCSARLRYVRRFLFSTSHSSLRVSSSHRSSSSFSHSLPFVSLANLVYLSIHIQTCWRRKETVG